jgi:hypothetical protein
MIISSRVLVTCRRRELAVNFRRMPIVLNMSLLHSLRKSPYGMGYFHEVGLNSRIQRNKGKR